MALVTPFAPFAILVSVPYFRQISDSQVWIERNAYNLNNCYSDVGGTSPR